MKDSKLIRLAFLGLILALASSSAYSYAWWTCYGTKMNWAGDNATFHVSTYSYSPGGSFRYAISRAKTAWNAVDADFTINLVDEYSLTHSKNGKNEIVFSSISAPGNTLIYKENCNWNDRFDSHYRIYEADIRIDSTLSGGNSWDILGPFLGDYLGSSTLDFELAMLHEMGHALGLNHDARFRATMNPNLPAGGLQGGVKWPFYDDTKGLKFLYGASTPKVDLAAAGLSVHSDNGLASGDSVVTPYNVTNFGTLSEGDSITVQYGIENLGTAQINGVKVKWYLSDNDYISNSDIALPVYGIWNIAPGTGEQTITTTIPFNSNLVSGNTYFVGFRIDPDNELTSENIKSNNSMVVATVTIN